LFFAVALQTLLATSGHAQVHLELDSVFCVGTQSLFYAERSAGSGSVFEYDVPPQAGYITENYTGTDGDSIWIQWGMTAGMYRIGVRELPAGYGQDATVCAGEWAYNNVYITEGVKPVFAQQAYRLCDRTGVQVSFNEDDFLNYWWSDTSIHNNKVVHPGIYELRAIDRNRCPSSATLTALPGITASLGNDTIICMPQFRLSVLDASANPEGTVYTWWSTEDELKGAVIKSGDDPYLSVYEHTLQRDVLYWVHAKYEECAAGDTAMIIACTPEEEDRWEIPNTITPNNDGQNDVWNIRQLQDYPNCEVEIFDRWGRRVFVARKGYTPPWDGKDMNGRALPVEAYYYIIKLNDGKQRSPLIGTIHIVK
jgi:gliding motility-associated-like protein